MWSLDLRSPRSDAQCRGGDRQDAFNQTQRNFMSVLRVNIWFHAAVSAPVLICFVTTCRHNLLIGAR